MYLITMFILLLVYILIIYLMKYMKNTKLFNFIFVFITVLCYLCLIQCVYNSVGLNDWNFTNTLPVANVSPFMFSILSFIFILPSKIRKYPLLLISLLSVGMLFSFILSCVNYHIIGYKFHFHFVLDYISHVSLSLLGIYLVKSKQVELNIKNALYSSIIIYFVAFVMIILNCIFDTSFFGLSLNGKHSIYNNVLVDNSYLSAFLYLFGLSIVLLLGYEYNKLLSKLGDFKCAFLKERKNIHQ